LLLGCHSSLYFISIHFLLSSGGNLTTPINENYPQIIDEKDGGAVVVKEAKKLDVRLKFFVKF
jgi:hypothetical protein